MLLKHGRFWYSHFSISGGLICIDTSIIDAKDTQGQTARTLALQAAVILHEAKGLDVIVLDVRNVTLIADYFVIVSGSSSRHVRALADRLQRTTGNTRKPMHVEGYQTGYWILLDYGDVVVHVFREEERDFYGLERLWGDAPQVDFDKREKDEDGKEPK